MMECHHLRYLQSSGDHAQFDLPEVYLRFLFHSHAGILHLLIEQQKVLAICTIQIRCQSSFSHVPEGGWQIRCGKAPHVSIADCFAPHRIGFNMCGGHIMLHWNFQMFGFQTWVPKHDTNCCVYTYTLWGKLLTPRLEISKLWFHQMGYFVFTNKF